MSIIQHTYCIQYLTTHKEANTLKLAFPLPVGDSFQLCVISMRNPLKMLIHPHFMVTLFIFKLATEN